jgi:hypothetical protein
MYYFDVIVLIFSGPFNFTQGGVPWLPHPEQSRVSVPWLLARLPAA